MPYRDRVIHLLALRPYKKPELLARLMKDGIREKDRNSLGAVLKQVAVMHKDNSYGLARHAWADVRTDWQYYTDGERSLAKKNIQQQETRSPTVSPAARPADSPPQKRAADDGGDAHPIKKQRISHHDKHAPQANGRLSNGFSSELSASAAGSHKLSSSVTNGNPRNDGDKNSSPIAESPSSNLENQEKGGDQCDTTVPDYVLQYPSIEDRKQRARYKEDFNHEYEEYRQLHAKVQNVARRFQYLRERISNTKEGSQDYEELKNKVLAEYQQQKNDTKFQERKRRVDYLHEKLGHIKRLIHDYDKAQPLTSCS